MFVDPFNRQLNYLRISVTDRCNLRCVYCMPANGVTWRSHSDILTYEEITRVARVAAEHGVTRIRLTGGEPLVRRGITRLVGMLAEIPEIQDLSLTTNGLLLADLAAPLKQAGLSRVNISLDTLNAERFGKMSRFGTIRNAYRGILAAEEAGLHPIKLNCVVVRGINDDELVELVTLSIDHDWEIRFIEIMPVENDQDWGEGLPGAGMRYISVQEMKAKLDSLHIRPEPGVRNGPAQIYRIPGAKGTVGFISPIGEHFCSTCNRLRLTADGNLRPCLLNSVEVPLRQALRDGEDLLPLFHKALNCKPAGHTLHTFNNSSGRRMSQIGG